MADVYIPPPTTSDPDPAVYYTIRGVFRLSTQSGAKQILPLAVQLISAAIQQYCVIDNFTALVRIIYPSTSEVNQYVLYVYFPKAVVTYSTDIYGNQVPVPVQLPQLGDAVDNFADTLTDLLQPGTPEYDTILSTVNAKLTNKVTALTLEGPCVVLTPVRKRRPCCEPQRGPCGRPILV